MYTKFSNPLLFSVVAISHCFDIDLGEVYLDNNGILNSMKNKPNSRENGPIKEPFPRNYATVLNQGNNAKDKPISKCINPFEIFDKKTPYHPVTEDPGFMRNQLDTFFKTKQSFKSDLFDIKEQLSEGIMNLNNIDNLGIFNSAKIQNLLDNATKIYTEQFNAYFKKASEIQPKTDLEREFVILDLIESTNHLLLVTAKKLMQSIHEVSPASYNHLTKLEDAIMEEKKKALEYVCEIKQVCRYYRGFVDKMGDLINEILILSDTPYSRIINDIIKAIEGKQWFLRKIMTVETRHALQSKLAPRKNHPYYIRELLTTIQRLITQRYRLHRNDTLEMKVKTTAARILLDLIDKVFHTDDEDFFNLEIDTTIASIKEWAEGTTSSKINPLKIINRIVEMLNYHWGTNTKEDVKVLIELLVLGTTRNQYVYEELFAKGAYNRRDDENEIHSDNE